MKEERRRIKNRYCKTKSRSISQSAAATGSKPNTHLHATKSVALNLTPVEELSDRLGIWRVTFDDTVVPAEAALTVVSLSPGVTVAQFNDVSPLRSSTTM